MTLRLYDSATRTQRDFEPLHPDTVGMYICGLTTQGDPHIGHVRFAVAFDILRRWLVRGHGYEVHLVRNVTDIDDKILAKAAENDRPWWAWSYRHEQATSAALDSLGVLPATYEPRATGHIPEMVELIETLIAKGHAYAAEDGSSDVYFDVRSWPEYGSLTRQRVEDMEPAGDADPRGKRDPRDFALWKGYKPSEPESASWPTPYGRGRPGWHLECSAMARKYLGDEFDIHGGGVDLRFPHHENEQAQSRAAGLGFARFWLHNAWVTVKGAKMGKSLGNALVVSQITREVSPLVLRYFLGSAHYRTTVEYWDGSTAEAAAAVERISTFLDRAGDVLGLDREQARQEAATAPIPQAFAAAMDDDINVSEALAVIFGAVREGNKAMEQVEASAAGASTDGSTDAPTDAPTETLRTTVLSVLTMTDVLGIDPWDPHWDTGSGDDRAQSALTALVGARLAQRDQARAERDFATADAIRDELAALGIVIEDGAAGARWTWGTRST